MQEAEQEGSPGFLEDFRVKVLMWKLRWSRGVASLLIHSTAFSLPVVGPCHCAALEFVNDSWSRGVLVDWGEYLTSCSVILGEADKETLS